MARGVARGIQNDEREDRQARREEVAGDVARLRHVGHAAALGEGEEDDRGGGQVGWAGQLGRPGRTGTGCTGR